MVFSLPKCSCSERSVDGRVFTCPECCRAALRRWDGERVDQHEMFEYLDNRVSMSAVDEDEGGLTHISKVLKGLAEADPFPF